MGTGADRYHVTQPITWERLHRDSKELARRLVETGPYRGIVAVTRGGLVPAAVVARELDIRTVETVCISCYDWQDQGRASVLKRPKAAGDGQGWLVVEDMVDSGATLRALRPLLPAARFAAVYAKPEGMDAADLHVREFSQDTWLLMPWDSEVQFIEPMAWASKKDDA